MAGSTERASGRSRQESLVVVAIVVGLGLIVTVGALVFGAHDSGSGVTAAATPTTATATTATTGSGTVASTTTTNGLAGVAFADPNKIYRMTLGADWTPGPPGFADSPTWLAPMGAAGTAQVNPLVSRAAGPDSLDQYVQSNITRLNAGDLYRTTTTEPTTLTDGSPATIVHYESANGTLLVGRAIITVKGVWGLTMLVQCPPSAADTCFAALDPYIKSVSLT